MIKKVSPLANDLVDRHGEVMPIETLKFLRDDTNISIRSSYKEHDYRFPPIARISKSFIHNKKGVNVLYGEIEYFEKNDINKQNKIKNKKLTVMKFEKPTITFDRSYEISGLKKDIEELQMLISNEQPQFELKKSLEPISTLIVAFGILAGKSFIEGFFNKAGADFWDKLKEIITKNSEINTQNQYIFTTFIENDRFSAEILINFTNPINSDLKDVLINNKEVIDFIVNNYYEKSTKVSKIVFNSFDNQNIYHEYSLFEDGTPFDIKNIEEYEKILDDVANQIR